MIFSIIDFLKKILCFVLLGSALISASAHAAKEANPRNVLVLSSFEYDLPAFEITLGEIRMALQRGLTAPVNLYVEHVDVERFSDERYSRQLFEFLRHKYADRKMDLFIPYGLNMLDLVSKWGRDTFGGIPTLFVEIGNRLPGAPPVSRQPNTTGVIMEFDLKKILETALSLHLDILDIYVVVGTSPSGRFAEALARVAYREYENKLEFSYLSDLTMRELLRRVNNLPKNSVIIFLTFQRDAVGMNYHQRDAVRLIAQGANVPVYVTTDAQTGLGGVGGYVVSAERAGVKAGEYALRILQGEQPDSLPLVREGLNVCMFDWRQLKRWNISEKRLPPGSIVKFKEHTAWELYRWYILAAIGFVFVEAVLILVLLVQRAKRRQSEERLQRAAEEWQTTFDSVEDLVMILDKEFKLIRANAATLSFFNLPLEKILGNHCYTLMHGTHEPVEICPFAKMMKTKRREETEIYDENKDTWFHVSVDPILNDKAEITRVVHTVKDITESKRAEGEAIRARRELLRVERLSRMGELTASLSHELNQPLAAILSNAQAALRFLKSEKPDLGEIHEILEDIIRDDKRAGGIIRGLRSMVKQEERERESIGINDMLNEVVSLFHSEAVVRNLKIERDFDESLPPVLADRVQLQQVAVNLIMNAAEAMEHNASEQRKMILKTRTTDNGAVRVTVSDFGPGIAEENLDRVFQSFFTTKSAGLGMGLPVSRSIVEAHGGRIWAENNRDAGVTFFFEIPVIGTQ